MSAKVSEGKGKGRESFNHVEESQHCIGPFKVAAINICWPPILITNLLTVVSPYYRITPQLRSYLLAARHPLLYLLVTHKSKGTALSTLLLYTTMQYTAQ